MCHLKTLCGVKYDGGCERAKREARERTGGRERVKDARCGAAFDVLVGCELAAEHIEVKALFHGGNMSLDVCSRAKHMHNSTNFFLFFFFFFVCILTFDCRACVLDSVRFHFPPVMSLISLGLVSAPWPFTARACVTLSHVDSAFLLGSFTPDSSSGLLLTSAFMHGQLASLPLALSSSAETSRSSPSTPLTPKHLSNVPGSMSRSFLPWILLPPSSLSPLVLAFFRYLCFWRCSRG